MFTTRTTSPYFSLKRAMAPVLLASSMGISLASTGQPARTALLTSWETLLSSSAVMAAKWVKSKRR